MDATVIAGIITAIGVAAGSVLTGWALLKKASAPHTSAVAAVRSLWDWVEIKGYADQVPTRIRRQVLRILDPKGENEPAAAEEATET